MKINIKYALLTLITLISITLVVLGNFYNYLFEPTPTPKILNKLPSIIPSAKFITFKWSIPFYFTMQSNFLAMIYFGLMTFNLIKPNKNKRDLIFELIVLLNLTITFIIYWAMIAPFDKFVNWFYISQNILVHIIVPLSFIFIWFYKLFKMKSQQIYVEYKKYWIFLIYPILYLLMVIILYHLTRETYIFKTRYNFSTNKLAKNMSTALSNADIKHEIGIKSVLVYTEGKVGNGIYLFFTFDIVKPWLPILVILGILIIFLIFIFTYLKILKRKTQTL